MDLSPKQQKRAEKLLKFEEDKDHATLECFVELDEKVDEVDQKIEKGIDTILKKIEEKPDPKDETENFQAVLNAIEKLNEPEEIIVELNIV